MSRIGILGCLVLILRFGSLSGSKHDQLLLDDVIAEGPKEVGLSVSYDPLSNRLSLVVNGKPWFEQSTHSRTFFTKGGTTYSESDGTLNLQDHIVKDGRDSIGVFYEQELVWEPPEFRTSFRTYDSGSIVVFKQQFICPQSLNGTQVSDDVDAYDVISSSFPSLTPTFDADADRRGFLSFGGNMAGWAALAVGELKNSEIPSEVPIRGGELGGPVAFFNEYGTEVVILSSLTHFMVSNMEVRRVKDQEQNVSQIYLDFGLMGSVQEIPSPGLELEFIAVLGSSFNEAFDRWGEAILKFHSKKKRTESFFSKYLGYWTDNGAFYYYNTLGENVTYEDTMLELNNYFTEESLPIRYMEIDSWWYYKDELQGVSNWTELPEIFPKGLDFIQESTGWPMVAHNRYWSKDTVYAEQNGGKFQFYIEEKGALPKDQDFWYYLFNEAAKWGLKVYEQDWLDIQFRLASITHTDLNAARSWLLEMGRGASVEDIELIYCMALPREVLQSAEIDAVTTARVSGDYILSKDQWRVGLSSFLSTSLGLAPFKDVFWTCPENPGSPFYSDCMIVSNNTDPNIPWTLNYRYNGYKNVTVSGKPCLNWYDLDLHWLAPNGDLERDACRTLLGSPWGEGKPFCFIKGGPTIDPSQWEWEECDIPVCGTDCVRDGIDPPDQDVPICDPVREPNPILQAVVSVLTRGGVGVGDKIGNVDVGLTSKTCRKDGHVIRPDKSVRAAPAQILRMAFSRDRIPSRPHSTFGEIWQTSTTFGDIWTVHTAFLAETKGFGAVDWDMLGFTVDGEVLTESYFYYTTDLISTIDGTSFTKIPTFEAIQIPDVSENEFVLLHVAPLWKVGQLEVGLIGETAKIVPVSNDRIVGFEILNDVLSLKISGSVDEEVKISWIVYEAASNETPTLVQSSCLLTRSGLAKVVLDSNQKESYCVLL